MKRYHGGESVAKGVYLHLADGEYIQLYGKTRVLPGDNQVKYIKVPGIVALLLGGIGGVAFVIFLPLIGIIGVIGSLAFKGVTLIINR